MTDQYPDNYSDIQHGRDLVATIRIGDTLELFNGKRYPARSEMQEREICIGCSDFLVSAWVQVGDSRWGMPIHHNAIVAVWRNGHCVYRMGEPLPQQMTLFEME